MPKDPQSAPGAPNITQLNNAAAGTMQPSSSPAGPFNNRADLDPLGTPNGAGSMTPSPAPPPETVPTLTAPSDKPPTVASVLADLQS